MDQASSSGSEKEEIDNGRSISIDQGDQSSMTIGHYARQLTTEEVEQLKRQDSRLVTAFKKGKLETESMKNWDKFYNRNENRFFKDRHWTKEEFKEICADLNWQNPMTMLEAGCGVGNMLFPFLEAFPNIKFAYACDFSNRAIDLLKAHSSFDTNRCKAFCCDLTTEDSLTTDIVSDSIDLCTLIFVLSAISEEKMAIAVRNIHKVMKTGGRVVVRDYGLYDYAMIRFQPGNKLGENAYVRQDGTRSYYFSEESMRQLFASNGFEVKSCSYVCKETINRKEDLCVPRIFIQGHFVKQ